MKKYLRHIIFALSCVYSISAWSDTYALVAAYGKNPNKITRWPNGTVYVYDYTKYPDLQKVLDIFNKNMTNTKLASTDNIDTANIKIELVNDFESPYTKACGLTHNILDETKTLYIRSLIQLKPSSCLEKVTILSLYIHELGHAMGFERHTDTSDVMSEFIADNGNYESINILTTFITGLYALEPGNLIDKNMKLPTSTGAAIVEKPTRKNIPLAELVKLNNEDKTKTTNKKESKPVEIITLKPLTTLGHKVDVIGPKGTTSTWTLD